MDIIVKSIVKSNNCYNEIARKKVLLKIDGKDHEYDYINKYDLYSIIVNLDGEDEIFLKHCYIGHLDEQTLCEVDKDAFSTYEIKYDTMKDIVINKLIFEDVIFNGDTVLVETTIDEELKFNKVIFNGGVTIKENFLKDDVEFIECISCKGFNLYHNELGRNLKFNYSNFIENFSITNIKCSGEVDIRNNIFNGKVDLSHIFNKIYMWIVKNKYTEKCTLKHCDFDKNFIISQNIFSKCLNIENCRFNDEFKITNTKVDEETNLLKNSFKKSIDLIESTFEKDVCLVENICDYKVDLNNSCFKMDLYFKDMEFKNIIQFDKVEKVNTLSMVNCFNRYRIHMDVNKVVGLCIIGMINDGGIYTKNLDNKSKKLIEACHSYEDRHKKLLDTESLNNNLSRESYYSKSYKNSEFIDIVSETILTLKSNANKLGSYEEEDNLYYAYKKEIIKPRNLENSSISNKYSKLKYLFKLIFEQGIGGFGTKPLRVLFTMLVVVIGFAIIYRSVGIEQFTNTNYPDVNINMNSVKYNIVFTKDLVNQNQFAPSIKNPNILAVYFSAITFFTIGYGDISAWNELVAFCVIVEGFLGVFLMSYLSVAFVRKLLR